MMLDKGKIKLIVIGSLVLLVILLLYFGGSNLIGRIISDDGLESSVRVDLSDSGEEFDYYMISFLYDGSISVVDWSLEKGNYPSGQDNKEFKVKLYSIDGEELYSSSFANPGMVFSDGVTGGGVMEVEDISFFINIPNIAGSEGFEIMDGNGDVVFEMSVSELKG